MSHVKKYPQLVYYSVFMRGVVTGNLIFCNICPIANIVTCFRIGSKPLSISYLFFLSRHVGTFNYVSYRKRS